MLWICKGGILFCCLFLEICYCFFFSLWFRFFFINTPIDDITPDINPLFTAHPRMSRACSRVPSHLVWIIIHHTPIQVYIYHNRFRYPFLLLLLSMLSIWMILLFFLGFYCYTYFSLESEVWSRLVTSRRMSERRRTSILWGNGHRSRFEVPSSFARPCRHCRAWNFKDSVIFGPRLPWHPYRNHRGLDLLLKLLLF